MIGHIHLTRPLLDWLFAEATTKAELFAVEKENYMLGRQSWQCQPHGPKLIVRHSFSGRGPTALHHYPKSL
jgi:hypothetical protein